MKWLSVFALFVLCQSLAADVQPLTNQTSKRLEEHISNLSEPAELETERLPPVLHNIHPKVYEVPVETVSDYLTVPVTMGDRQYRFVIDVFVPNIYVSDKIIDESVEPGLWLPVVQSYSQKAIAAPDITFFGKQLALHSDIQLMTESHRKNYKMEDIDGVLGQSFLQLYSLRFTEKAVTFYSDYPIFAKPGILMGLVRETTKGRSDRERLFALSYSADLSIPVRLVPTLRKRIIWNSRESHDSDFISLFIGMRPPNPLSAPSSSHPDCEIPELDMSLYPEWAKKDSAPLFNLPVKRASKPNLWAGCPWLLAGLLQMPKYTGPIVLHKFHSMQFEGLSPAVEEAHAFY